MDRAEKAISNFGQTANCAQCVLLAFSNELGLGEELAYKITSGFGGGMCQGEVCGAVSGAIVAINLKYGPDKPEDNEAKDEVYNIIRQFTKEFKNVNGSVICKELLGCDLDKEGMRKQARENGLFLKVCPKFIKDAIAILESKDFLAVKEANRSE